MNCMNYDHSKHFGLIKFQLGYGKFYFNSPEGYSGNIINMQTDKGSSVVSFIYFFTSF